MAWSITSFSGTENTSDAVTNTSSVSWSWTLKTTNGSYDHTGKAWYRVYTTDGTYDTGRLTFKPGASSGSKTKTYTGTTGNFAHNSDGSLGAKEFRLEFYETATYNTHTSSYTQYFTTYARYASITSFSVNKRDETSLNVTWGANVACDAVQYRIRQSGGSYGGWIGVNGTNFNITGLKPNTTYVVQIQVRRSDSGLWTTSGDGRQTTYDYPYASSLPNFVIGERVIIDFYNPLSRIITYEILDTNDVVVDSDTGSIGGIAVPVDEDKLYSSIPNNTSGTYKVRVTYGSNVDERNSGTYSINSQTNVPTFENFTTQYTADKTDLTNNNQTVINKKSTITFQITANATAQNYATISKYLVSWGDSTPLEITDITQSIQLTNGSGNLISVVAYDSRNLNSTYNVEISEVVEYTAPTNLQVKLHRRNGVEETTYADISGTLYYDTFGTNGVHNLLKGITYSVAGGGTDMTLDISTVTYSSQDLTNHTQRFTLEDVVINENTSELGFDPDKSYTVTFNVKDTTDTQTSIVGGVASGRFAEDWFQDENGEYHMGINGQADEDYTETVHGDMNILGNYYRNGLPFDSGDTLPYGAMVEYDGDTVPDGYEEIQKSKVLFNNASGSTGTITLSDDISNYSRLEIQYVGAHYLGISGMIIELSFNQNISLISFSSSSASGVAYFAGTIYSISGNTLTPISYRTFKTDTGVTNDDNYINIKKIVGYK